MGYGRLEADGDRRARVASGSARPADAPPVAAPLLMVRAIFLLFAVGVLLRIFLTDQIVNLFWPYTAEGGIFPGKIHPGSYFIFAAAAMLYVSPGYRFAGNDLPMLRAVILFVSGALAAAALPMLQGRNGPAGYVLDVYLAISVACIFLLAMPPKWRCNLGIAVITALCMNTALSIGEFATGRYILPIEAAEFRPTAFLGAALNVGVINLSVCVFVISLPVHWLWKYGVVSLLMLGVMISGSRTAMLIALLVIPVSMLITARLRKAGVSMGATAVLMVIFATTLLPLLFLLFSELGFLDRFKDGYIDDSAQTRIEIYRVFEFVGWRDIILGTDILTIRKIAQEMLNIELIESAIVFFVFDFGLVCTLIFAGLFLWMLWQFARHSHPVIGLGLVVFLVLALSNNTLSTKVPSTFAVLVLAVALSAFHRDGRRL